VTVSSGRDGRPVKILKVEGQDYRLRAQRFPGPGGEELLVRWGPLEGDGELRSDLLLWTDLFDEPVPVRVVVDVQDLLILNPATIQVLAAPPNRPLETTIRLARRDGLAVQVVGMATKSNRFQYDLRREPGDGSQLIRVTVPVPALPREVDASLIIDTDARPGGRIELPIRVRARDSSRTSGR
jgi:hypothetical protein